MSYKKTKSTVDEIQSPIEGSLSFISGIPASDSVNDDEIETAHPSACSDEVLETSSASQEEMNLVREELMQLISELEELVDCYD